MTRTAAALIGLSLALSGQAQTPQPPAPFVPPPELLALGAPVDVAAFRHRRPLREGPPGLVALQLDPAVLSGSRGPGARFADVRIVTPEGRQIPYILEERDEPLSLDLALQTAESRAALDVASGPGSPSVYAVQLPQANLPGLRIELSTPDRVFRRPVTIGAERPPDRSHRNPWLEPLASQVWQHADPEAAAPPLALRVSPPSGTARLLVVVDEGDNRPLALSRARLLLPSWRLRFFRPEGPLLLAYGHDGIAQPEYDLGLLRPAVLGADAPLVEAAAAGAADVAPARLVPLGVFWAGLGLAALALLALIVRLLRPPVSFR